MKKQYFRIAINIWDGYKYISYTVAISEPFEEFTHRNKEENHRIVLLLCVRCTKREYLLYKKYNPSEESYVKLLKRDCI